MGAESVPCIAFTRGQQNLGRRTVHDAHTLAFEVSQACEGLASRCHDGVADTQKCIALLNAFDTVGSVSRQSKVSVTTFHGVAQSAALVERQPPHVFHRGAQLFAHHFSQIDVQTFVRTFRFAKGQVVRVGTHTQRLSGQGPRRCQGSQNQSRQTYTCRAHTQLKH